MKKLLVFVVALCSIAALQATRMEVYNATKTAVQITFKPPLLGGWAKELVQPDSVTMFDVGCVGSILAEFVGFGGPKLEIGNSNADKCRNLRVYIMKIGKEFVLTSGWPVEVKKVAVK